MRLFHVSEEENIEVFRPIKPYREDLKSSPALVWAITEKCLPNFLTPRQCPRVTYHVGTGTTEEDRARYFSSDTIHHVVAIEHKWFEIMKNTTLYLYEFDPENFTLQDGNAGYYVSEEVERPINKFVLTDLFEELFKRNVEVRLIPGLWDLCEEIRKTTLNWSFCRMGNAERNGEK